MNSYTWDRANRLLSMGGVDYQYDGEGRRVQQTASSTITKYLLDIQPSLAVVLSETAGANVIRNVFSPRGIHAQQDSSDNWQWIGQDGLGNVREVVDNSVGVLESRNYGPYGDAFGGTITSALGYEAPNFGFTGELVDGSGLLDLRARRYNAALGTFASLDPFEGQNCRPMSLNGYSWVEGNVVNAIDPSGKATTFLANLIPSCSLNNVCPPGWSLLQHSSGGLYCHKDDDPNTNFTPHYTWELYGRDSIKTYADRLYNCLPKYSQSKRSGTESTDGGNCILSGEQKPRFC